MTEGGTLGIQEMVHYQLPGMPSMSPASTPRGEGDLVHDLCVPSCARQRIALGGGARDVAILSRQKK